MTGQRTVPNGTNLFSTITLLRFPLHKFPGAQSWAAGLLVNELWKQLDHHWKNIDDHWIYVHLI
jgi:hypothetical protein